MRSLIFAAAVAFLIYKALFKTYRVAMDTQLSKYFNLSEMTRSTQASEKGIDNTASPEIVYNLKLLTTNVLDPIRERLGVPVYITSGYRCPALNSLVGGVSNSQHVKGQAADIHTDNMSTEQLYQWVKQSGIPYDQLIQEFDSWVHVSFADNPRKMALRITTDGTAPDQTA